MASDPQLFRVSPEDKQTEKIQEVDFSQLGHWERRDIQEWVANNPSILGDDLLVISKEFSGFDRTDERLDLLAVDTLGKLVIIELKRDDSGADVHWQAIKYASYLKSATAEDIVTLLADYEKLSEDEARDRLLDHISADDLATLNNDQRIILASHRFATEVTSAVVWLNQKARASGEDMITCVKLIPFRDSATGVLYLQSVTIIPVPGVDDYVVGIGRKQQGGAGRRRAAIQHRRNDEVTHFAQLVAEITRRELSSYIRPDNWSWYARGSHSIRYFDMWYGRRPWRRGRLCHRITFRPGTLQGGQLVHVRFFDKSGLTLEARASVGVPRDQFPADSPIAENTVIQDGLGVVERLGTDILNEDFAQRIAGRWKWFIEEITPLVDTWHAEVQNSEDDEALEDDDYEDEEEIGGTP